MIVKLEEFSKALEKGLNPSKFLFLLVKQDGAEYLCNDFLSDEEETDLLLNGYIYSNLQLTPKAIELLKEIHGDLSSKIDNKWEILHKKLQDELIRLTNKKQAKANGGYTFLCNEVDLRNKLSKCITKYKLKDWEKIEKLLILHINKAYKQNFDKVMLIAYYIEKNGTSTLASDYDNFEEKEEVKQQNKQVFDI